MKIINWIVSLVWNLLIAGILISIAVWVGSYAIGLFAGGFNRIFTNFQKK